MTAYVQDGVAAYTPPAGHVNIAVVAVVVTIGIVFIPPADALAGV